MAERKISFHQSRHPKNLNPLSRSPVQTRPETASSYRIDAPEIKQPFGQQSKQALSALVFGKDVEIRASGKDRYGRTLARVFVDGTDVNLAMVKAGMAWRFDKYSKDGAFQTAQEDAQRALWADPAPTPPWEWRAAGKAGR